MSPKIEIPLPPGRPHPGSARVEPPWVPFEPRWEYRELVRDLESEGLLSEAELNDLGSQHWELAGITRVGERVHFYFKREQAR